MERIGGYEVVRELARGGMGIVYVARDVQLDRQVALKLMQGLALGERDERRFTTEAETLARLRHPNVVGVHGAGHHLGRPYLAMEWVEGESLGDLLKRNGPLDPQRAAGLVRDVARGIQHAHEQGVLHRDLKPDNLLLDAEGRARVTDFGLAFDLADQRQRLTETGTLLGTPGFLPPEQADGNLAAIGPRSDVYGLGATLYALLSGAPPFRGASPINVIAKVIGEPPPPLSGIDPALERVCLRCLEKDPDDRYGSAAELADALQAYLTGDPAPQRSVWGLVVFTVVVLAAALAVVVASQPDAVESTSTAPDVAQDGEGKTAPAADPPSERRPVQLVPLKTGLKAGKAVLVRRGDEDCILKERNKDWELTTLDGRALALSEPQRLVLRVLARSTRPGWAVAGQSRVSPTKQARLRSIPLDQGEAETWELDGQLDVLVTLAPQPGGALLAVLGSWDAQPRVLFWHETNGESKRGVRIPFQGEALAWAADGSGVLVVGRSRFEQRACWVDLQGDPQLLDTPFTTPRVVVGIGGRRFLAGDGREGLWLVSPEEPARPVGPGDWRTRTVEGLAAAEGWVFVGHYAPQGELKLSVWDPIGEEVVRELARSWTSPRRGASVRTWLDVSGEHLLRWRSDQGLAHQLDVYRLR